MPPQSLDDLLWLSELMSEFPRPWFVAGGWAIDLHVGKVTRPHEDADVAILRRDQEALQHYLPEWEFQYAVPGKRGFLESWEEGAVLEPPIHEIHATHAEGAALEFLLNESTGGVWRFRRMMEIARPLSKMRHVSPDGIPYVAPEIVLLYKAKEPSESDEMDFRVARPLLAEEASEWFRISLEACYPEHPWLSSL